MKTKIQREERRGEDASLRSAARLRSYWSKFSNKWLGNSEPEKRKGSVLGSLVSLSENLSQQSPALRAKKEPISPIATKPTSHAGSSESSNVYLTFRKLRPTENPALLPEAAGRRHLLLAVLREIPFKLFFSRAFVSRINSTAGVALNLRTSCINAVGMASIKTKLFFNAINVRRILRVLLNFVSLWISHAKVRRITVICAHVVLLVPLILTQPRTECPALDTSQGKLPCDKVLSYIREMTLEHEASAKKLLVSEPHK